MARFRLAGSNACTVSTPSTFASGGLFVAVDLSHQPARVLALQLLILPPEAESAAEEALMSTQDGSDPRALAVELRSRLHHVLSGEDNGWAAVEALCGLLDLS